MKELLRIDNLIVTFRGGSITAVRGVDLEVGEGETIALVGESGCGKTVLCKSMLGFLCAHGAVEDGSVEFRGEDITKLDERKLVGYRGGEIAMIPQDPMTSLDPMVSVGEQIAEAVRLAGRAKRSEHRGTDPQSTDPKGRAMELMRRVGIEDAEGRYDQRPYQFSGGMRQRIVIAIALAGEPRLILADEPTTALDEDTQREVLDLIKTLQREHGFGMVFITHDLHLVSRMAERVAIMKDGCIVEEGSVEEVFREPKHQYTKQLLGYLDYYHHRGHIHRAADESHRPAEATCEQVGEKTVCGATENEEEAAKTGDIILRVSGLNKSYDNLEVLRDFELTAYRGEILGIVGRSGCGKSTLAGCIMGIEPYEDGEIEIAGGRGRAQMIFQGTQDAFNHRMTIGQIVAEPLHIRRRQPLTGMGDRMKQTDGAGICHCPIPSIEDRVLDTMDEVGLDRSLIHRRPYELSGGQRQRAAIARALIADPDLVIADEPLTGLDVTAQARIVHLLRRLVDERGLSLILIAHDRPMVEHVSDRIVEMDQMKK